ATLPTVEGVTFGGDVAGLITADKGMLLSNANTTQNNYTDKPFITFASAQGSGTNKLTITYDVAYQDKSKGQPYSDYTMSYYGANGQFLFSLTESVGGNWSDKASIIYATGASTKETVALSTHIGKKVTAEFYYDADGGCFVGIDGGVYNVYSGEGVGIKDIKLTVGGGQDYNRGVFIKNYKITGTEVVPKAYRTVAFNVDDTSSTAVVEKGTKIAASDIPAAEKLGYLFMGWSTDGSSEYDESKTYISNDELKDTVINDNKNLTAVFQFDTSYKQKIAKVEFVDTAGNAIDPQSVKAIKYPTEAEAVEYKPYEIKVTSDVGRDITDDCEITWEAVGGGGLDANYFQFVEKSLEDDEAVAEDNVRYARIRQGGESWFGYIKATATYLKSEDGDGTVPEGISSKDGVVTVKNDTAHADLESATLICATYSDSDALTSIKTYPLTFTEGVATKEITDMADGSKLMVWSSVDGDGAMVPIYTTADFTADFSSEGTAQVPCAVLANSESTQIMPAAGYPASMDYYVDELVGYKGTSDDYSKGYDPVLNNWCIVGSSPTRDLVLVEDEDGVKALKFASTGGSRGGSGSSALAAYAFAGQSTQYVLDATVKFDGASVLGVWDKTPNNSGAVSEWSISYDGGTLTVGDGKITGVTADTWYKLIVTSDPVNHLYSVYVYDKAGTTLIGSVTDAVGSACSAKFLCVSGGLPFYINSIQAYIPSVETVAIDADTEVVSIPDAGEPANEVSLRANCQTADGIKLTGAVEWSLDEEYEGVELVKGTQTATLKVSNGASGSVVVSATLGGKTATKTITLTTSKDIVAFKTKSSSITIPFAGGESATADFKADTVTTEHPEGTNDTSIEYSFLDKTGAVALSALPSGISSSVDASTNTLTLSVAPGATPIVFYIKATNSEG
ncbi:MAG: InlB B-repeat-containing protein, partial [Clostridia bacterium]|nr:InlB B-repeat-containing protein [Clostridia bacterium]